MFALTFTDRDLWSVHTARRLRRKLPASGLRDPSSSPPRWPSTIAQLGRPDGARPKSNSVGQPVPPHTPSARPMQQQ